MSVTDANFPLFVQYDPDTTAIEGKHCSYTQGELLSAAHRLASQLPDQAYLLNLCQRRGHFVVGLIAALLTDTVMLLPVSRHGQDIAMATERFGHAVSLVDGQVAAVDQLSVTDILAEDGASVDVANPQFPSAQPLAIAFTSGSTGSPQCHAKTWGVLSNTARSLCQRFALSRASALIGTVPAQHMYGLEMTALMMLQCGGALADETPFFPREVAACATQVQRTPWLVTTPLHLRALLETRLPPTRFAGIVSATAPLSKDLAARAEAAFQCRVQEIYGCTEAGSIATRVTTESDDFSLLPGIEFIQGEVPTLRVPEIAEPVPLADHLEIKQDSFRLVGRSDDMINVAGKRFSLAQLNQYLLEIPEIEDGVIFMPEDGGIGRPAALVVSELSSREIALKLGQRVDATFIPRPITKVVEIPRNATGKVVRGELLKLTSKSR